MAVTAEKQRKSSVLIKKFVLILVVLSAATFSAALFSGKDYYEERVSSALAFSGITYKNLDVSWRGHYSVKDATLRLRNNSLITIAEIDGQLSFDGETINYEKMTDVQYHLSAAGDTTVKIPELTLHNFVIDWETPLNDKEQKLPANLRGNAKARADAVSLPRIEIEQALSDSVQKHSYTNVLLSNIHDGTIDEVGFDGSTTDIKYDPKIGDKSAVINVSATTGKAVIKDVNYSFITDLLTQVKPADDQNNTYQRLYKSFSLDNAVYRYKSLDNSVPSFSIGHISSSNLSMRLLPFDILNYLEKIGKLKDPNLSHPQTIYAETLDILQATGPFDFRLTDLRSSLNDIDQIKIGQLDFAFDGNAFKTDAFHSLIRVEDNIITIDQSGSSGVRFPELINLLKENIPRLISDDPNSIQPETADQLGFAMIPQFDELYLKGLALHYENPLVQGQKGVEKIGEAVLQADFSQGSIPTKYRLAVRDSVLPSAAFDPFLASWSAGSVKKFSDLGYDTINTDATFSAIWDGQKNQPAINNLSIDIKDFANLQASATLGDVNISLSTESPAVISNIFLGDRLIDGKLTVNVDGFLSRYLNKKAETDSRKVEDMRNDLAMQANALLRLLLQENISQKIKPAIEDFIKNGGSLILDAQAIDENGIDINKFIMPNSPSDLENAVNKLDINARTQH